MPNNLISCDNGTAPSRTMASCAAMNNSHWPVAFAIVAFCSLGVACGSDNDSKESGGTDGTAGAGATGGSGGSVGTGGADGSGTGGTGGSGGGAGTGGTGASGGSAGTGGAGGSSGSAGTGGATGGATFSCVQTGGTRCMEFLGVTGELAGQLREQCTRSGGTAGSGCSRNGASGVCTTTTDPMGSRIVYYGLSADQVSTARQGCESVGGMWSAN